MAHPKLQLSRLLDWVKLRIECEDTPPTDDQIVAFLGLDSEQTARSMLADLADRGDITIKGTGPTRQIALGRLHRTIETPRPVPSVVKPAKPLLSEEECVRRIQMITGRSQAPKQVSPAAPLIPSAAGEGGVAGVPSVLPSDGALCQTAAPPPFDPEQSVSPAAEMEAPASGEGERRDDAIVQPVAPSVPIAAPPYPDLPAEVIANLSERGKEAVAEGKPLAIERLPTAPGRRVASPNLSQYQVNIKVSAERYAELRRRANGGHVGPVAKQIFDAAMDGERVEGHPSTISVSPEAMAEIDRLMEAQPGVLQRLERPHMFRIPAEVTRAAIRDGIPVLDLAATLMMRGLGSFEQDAAREIAA